MNTSRKHKLAIILLGSGLLAAGSAFGQGNSGANANSSPSPSPSRPITPPPAQAEPPSSRAGSGIDRPGSRADRTMPTDIPSDPNPNPRSRLDRPMDPPEVLPNDPVPSRRGTNTYGASNFKTLDIDNDGRLSRAEFIGSTITQPNADRASSSDTGLNVPPANTESEFAVLDADKDGYLSQSELASAHAKVRR